MIGWKLIFGYKVQQQQIHCTVEWFLTNQTLEDILYPGFWLVRNRRCDMNRPKIDVVGHCLFKTLPCVILGFFAHLIEDNALNDLHGKMFDTFGVKFATMKRSDLLREYVFQRHLAAMIYGKRFLHLWSVAVFQAELFQGNQIYTVVLSITLNSFFTAFYGMIKIYKMYSPVTCLRHAQIHGMTTGHVSFHWTCIALHSVC